MNNKGDILSQKKPSSEPILVQSKPTPPASKPVGQPQGTNQQGLPEKNLNNNTLPPLTRTIPTNLTQPSTQENTIKEEKTLPPLTRTLPINRTQQSLPNNITTNEKLPSKPESQISANPVVGNSMATGSAANVQNQMASPNNNTEPFNQVTGSIAGGAFRTVTDTKKEPGKKGIRLPWVGDTIRFPLKFPEPQLIIWSENGDAYDGLYHHIRARWIKNTDTEGVNHGEVSFWVAQEFVDPEWKDIWAKEQECMGAAPEKPYGEIKIKADGGLMYGQSRDLTRRFIVYHPKNRKPSQGRFMQNTVNLALNGLSDFIPGFADVQINENTLPRLNKMFQQAFGHELRAFEAAEDDELKKSIQAAFVGFSKDKDGN